ncbi:MAG: polysulfide reductase NrfD [Chloroflexi bacterium]|jgi:molybdopterin-containing oxidoreductase family membrane subunit|nr:polysulfide reductase NrfD [Chloroflexota bacterium]
MTAQVASSILTPDPRAAFRFARSDIGSWPRALRAWVGLLLLLCAIGAVGAVLALPPGWEVLGTSPSFEWGILITAYVFFAITTSGLCLASSLGTVFGIEMFLPLEKRHAVLAWLSLVTAFGIIALDLHYPISMVFGAVLSPSPFSPMWWMGVFYGVYLVSLSVEVWSIFAGRWDIHRYACTFSSIIAVAAPTTLGAVFAVLAARPYWHGAFTPPAMVTMAVLSGTALLGIVFWAVFRYRLAGWERAGSLAIPAIRLILTIGLVVSALVVAWETLWGMYGVIPGLADATRAVFAGPLALQFWVVRVGLGLVAPLALLAYPRTRTPKGLLWTSVLVFIGIFADRCIFVSAGQIVPGTAVGGVVSTPYAEYFPSLVEIAIVVGAFGFFGLVYTLAERWLPMDEHFGHGAGGILAVGVTGQPMVEVGVAWVADEEAIAVVHPDAVALEPTGVVEEPPVDASAEAPEVADAAAELPEVAAAAEAPAEPDRRDEPAGGAS